MIKKIYILFLLFISLTFSQQLWRDVDKNQISFTGERVIFPLNFRVLQLNTENARILLKSAPLEFEGIALTVLPLIELPLPDGSFQRFKFWESPTMEPELQEKFPEIRTYTGQGIDDPYATLKMDFTPHGFHAMILSLNGRVFIDPYAKGNTEYYISYYSKDYIKENSEFECEVFYHDEYIKPDYNYYESILTPTGPQLRTYRLANAATGEYTQYHGGTVALGLAAVTTSINRVNGVYEKEVAVRMVLVANNNLIIYTNPSTDPYSNNNGTAMLTQNITNLNSVIGSANYDIGHVFSTGGGGVAYLGCVCTSNKAGGVTGSPNPIGDPFDIDYVAHEMGHQFGANHTFNGNTGSCAGNRNASTAYEPGSGSTIMAYAGICAPQNLQSNSDAYFHTISFDEIVAFTNSGTGNSCAQITSTGNNPPTNITIPSGGFYIPKNTPFALRGNATDPNGDALTFCWEEFDLGPAGDPNSPSGDAPIIRSFNPDTSRIRYVPRLPDIINNTSTYGVLLPSYSRNLKFRLTVRDNRAAGGGVDWRQVNFAVDGNSGPFTVTSPNTSVTWAGNSQQTVTWNVANTNLSPVNCSTVRILLSTDGGWNFNDTILSSTPNDGSQLITVPNIATTQARIKVEAINNIFFDISDQNFTITFTAVAFQLTVQVENGWNLVSIPGLHPINQNPETWWQYKDPNAGVYSFNNGYSQVNNLEPGIGYWMKHLGGRVYNTGDEWPASGILYVPHNPIPVNAGWNIVGIYENQVSVSGITTNPPAIIQSSFYGYNSLTGYQVVNTLLPGYGYWIKFSTSGSMILPSLTEMTNSKEANIIKPEWIKIKITDSDNRSSALYLTDDITDFEYFELPPLPFPDLFDIRFSTNRFVDKISDKNEIVIQGAKYPIRISIENNNFLLSDENGITLKKDVNSFIIDSPETKKIILTKKNIPDEFFLEQNYPNPFNPATKIRYSVPLKVKSQNSKVEMKVYDILGNEVATLVNEEKSPGFYEIDFDGSFLTSGIYYYRLKVGEFNSVKKMILIK